MQPKISAFLKRQETAPDPNRFFFSLQIDYPRYLILYPIVVMSDKIMRGDDAVAVVRGTSSEAAASPCRGEAEAQGRWVRRACQLEEELCTVSSGAGAA